MKELAVNYYICGTSQTFSEFAAAVRKAGIKSVGITRAAIAELGLAGLETCLADHGLTVSSLNSAGYFTGHDPNLIKFSNEELVEAAARLNAEVLCVITGGLGTPGHSTAEAHQRINDGFVKLARRAAENGVVLGLEPIYPGDILTKGCINSLAHGLQIIEPFSNAKLIIDLFHTWWDPDLSNILHTQSDQVALIQLCNIRTADGLVVGRETLSDGELDLSQLLPTILSENYQGKLELELFDRDMDGRNPLAILAQFPGELRRCLGD